MLKEYHQFSACSKFTYGQLLDKYLDKAVNLGLLLENNKAPLMQHKINVFLYTSLEETRKRLCATVDDSCEPIVGSESKYIQFVFESFEQKRIPHQTDAFSKMMLWQQDLVVPTQVPGTSFPLSQFNFLVEGYVDADLGVSRTDLPVLESLTRATRDVLQNIGKFWRSKFPLQFQHQLEWHNTQDCTTNTRAMIERHSTVLNQEMRKASWFLATNQWAEFHQDLLQRYVLMEKQISHLTKESEKVQQNQVCKDNNNAENKESSTCVSSIDCHSC
jgi:hypothetical protein